jgi:PAS domain S-box-containing protein
MLKGDMGGIEASEQIRSKLDIPIVYLTAYSDDELLKRAKTSEAYSYLIKPFKESELHTVIQISTHQHKMEKDLRLSLARYQAVVEDQNELICRFNSDLEITFINNAYCRYLSKPLDKLIGTDFIKLVRVDERDRLRSELMKLSPRNPVYSVEQQLDEPFGESHWQLFDHRAIFDYHETLIEYQSVGRDITERKQMEIALRESEERFKILFENIPMTVMIYDESGDILHVNELGIKQLGWPVEKLIGSSIDQIKPQGLSDSLFGKYDSGTRRFKTVFKKPSGNVHEAEVWESKIEYLGRIAYLCIISFTN